MKKKLKCTHTHTTPKQKQTDEQKQHSLSWLMIIQNRRILPSIPFNNINPPHKRQIHKTRS